MHAEMPRAASARRSSSEPTPPDAMTGTGVCGRQLRGRLEVRPGPRAVARDVRVEHARRAARPRSDRTRSTARTRVGCVHPSTATKPSLASTATMTTPGSLGGERAHERFVLHGRRSEHDAYGAERQVRLEALARPHAAADLDARPERLHHRADDGSRWTGRPSRAPSRSTTCKQRHLAAPVRERARAGRRRRP